MPPLDDFWMDKHFLQDLRDAYAVLCGVCEGVAIVTHDGAQENTIIAREVASFYDSLTTETPTSGAQLDLGRYVMQLESTDDR